MQNLFDLSGKVAVITGSSKGIGKAIALAMAQHGARVVVWSRKLEPCAAGGIGQMAALVPAVDGAVPYHA